MKSILCLLSLLLLLMTLAGIAENTQMGRILLYTYYRQVGWGDLVQIGCIDDTGTLWYGTGSDSKLKWPYGTSAQLEYLKGTDILIPQNKLGSDVLFQIESLVSSAEKQDCPSEGVASDAGDEYSYALQYDREGNPDWVLLGLSGDDRSENTDPNAQALYRYLRILFPNVTTYAYTGMGPQGFVPIPISIFLKWPPFDPDTASIQAVVNDCEAGPIPHEADENIETELRSLAAHGWILGKANAISTTGGSTSYIFRNENEDILATLELYDGLLVAGDGMYFYSDSLPDLPAVK